MKSQKILVTGGTGYIGSHTVVELLGVGYDVVIFDNLANSSALVVDRIEQITKRRPILVKGDVRDQQALRALFNEYEFDAVLHFAGLKAVGESVQKPLLYYINNVQGALILFSVMAENNCHKIVFSSSATVYGDPSEIPITEQATLITTNPYGQSKLMVEQILQGLAEADQNWQISILRYFNPVAAHSSGLIGEDPNEVPSNLAPYISQVAIGRLAELSIFGSDYDTPDGTGIRDYIHVVDLAAAHLSALKALSPAHGCQAYNIGTGQGYSVLELVSAFERASGVSIPYKMVDRRAGDVARCFADPSLSYSKLGWRAERGLDEMMRDQWNWQSKNPHGYN